MDQVIDLFSGAGGFGLGFALAGFNTYCSLEIDEWASDTIRYNSPGMKVISDDIRKYNSPETVAAVCPQRPDIIIGGPPCQGFSIAGPSRKDPRDPRNSLFLEFARWVNILQPEVFVMENVKGLLSRRNAEGESVISIIRKTFREMNYSTELWLLNAAEYGVPEIRERIFIVGNRIGIEIGQPPKTHTLFYEERSNSDQLELFKDPMALLPSVTLWEAISDMPELAAGEGEEEQEYTSPPMNEYQRWIRGDQAILFNHVAMSHSKRMVERFKHVKCGESGADAPLELRALKRNGNGELSTSAYDQNNRRLHPNRPSHTIAASFYANFIHPFQHRNLTAREGARIQSFPDWYRFMGKKTVVSQKLLHREGRLEETHLCQYNQIGNAVPPLLAKAIAEQIRRATNRC